MLNNKDFKSLLLSGGIASRDEKEGGKTRFDLKQISAWDKQNKSKQRRSYNDDDEKPKGRRIGSKDKDGNSDSNSSSKYRDRASERRLGIDKSAEDIQLEALVSKLDAEQTKYLGGDVDHTHLVKGLDYALLRKSRETEKPSVTNELSPTNTKSDKEILKTAETGDINVETALGSKLKSMFFAPSGQLYVGNKVDSNEASVKLFKTLAFEFNLKITDDHDELPTIISRSRYVNKCNCVDLIELTLTSNVRKFRHTMIARFTSCQLLSN